MYTSKLNYYNLLGLEPSASMLEIRCAYRRLSKCYHPDTTDLSASDATAKFQQLNEAYATLSNPERRFTYDLKIGYSPFGVIQPPPSFKFIPSGYDWTKSAYLDATDRPLSGGELFALFILVVTFVGCLILAVAIGITRGDSVSPTAITQQLSNITSVTTPF